MNSEAKQKTKGKNKRQSDLFQGIDGAENICKEDKERIVQQVIQEREVIEVDQKPSVIILNDIATYAIAVCVGYLLLLLLVGRYTAVLL